LCAGAVFIAFRAPSSPRGTRVADGDKRAVPTREITAVCEVVAVVVDAVTARLVGPLERAAELADGLATAVSTVEGPVVVVVEAVGAGLEGRLGKQVGRDVGDHFAAVAGAEDAVRILTVDELVVVVVDPVRAVDVVLLVTE